MNDSFTNRLGMFRTVADYLFDPANNPKWNGQPPVRFTTRAAEAASAVNALEQFCQQQSTVITGSAADKAREERELEDAAHLLGNAVAECCRTLGDEHGAQQCEFSLSAWRRMRNAHLLGAARTVIASAQSVLSAHPAEAAECGITGAAITACTQEADDYEAVISAPQQAIATRKGLTMQMRQRFNDVEAIFASMDGLVDQFADQNFVQGYKAARTVRDLGHGPGESEPPPPTPPNP